jgi:hypothetical protein
VDIGAPQYTREYFRDSRYRFLAARSLGHSLPVVNRCEQAAGPQYASRALTHEFGPDHAEFSVDITGCYPANARCNDLSRSFYLDKRGGVLRVKEYFELPKPDRYETAIITAQPVRIENGIGIIQGKKQRFVIKPASGTVIEDAVEQGYRGHDGKPARVFRVALKPEKLTENGSIAYRIEIAN